jgi:hypothetical protein
VPNDPGPRIFPPAGVIRGAVVYQGPRPCSRNGHIVGNAVVLVFDRRNPPPPNGLAASAVTFTDVTGDRLFADEPRYPGDDTTYCPSDHGFTETITASGNFEIAPIAGGSYLIQAFFDYTGNWLPEFKFRNLPEQGDVAGGDVDTADALKPINAGNPNYQPRFLPVEVGIPQPMPAGAPPNAVPNYTIPSTGFVRENVTVTVGQPLALTRPYFVAKGEIASVGTGTMIAVTPSQSSDAPATVQVLGALESPNDPYLADYLPVLAIPQDIQVYAPPAVTSGPVAASLFESKFPRLRLEWGVAAPELPKAVAPPFKMQIAPFAPGSAAGGGFSVWQNAAYDPASGTYVPQQVAEGNSLPFLWPAIVLTKLIDDYAPDASGRFHTRDPASLTVQGDPSAPVVILQGITEAGSPAAGTPDSLFQTVVGTLTGAFFDGAGQPKIARQDHLTVLLRPSVICFDTLFDGTNPDKRGTLVTPSLMGAAADDPNGPAKPLVPTDILSNDGIRLQSIANLVKTIVPGCLPKGRYAINVVYPDGQAWTVPNEAGACSGSEGVTDYTNPDSMNLTCTVKPRPVLYSQGNRAVVEIVDPTDPANCKDPAGKVPPTPAVCLPH